MRSQLHRRLLWLWKSAPFPLWLRRLFLRLVTPCFLIGALAIVEDEQERVLMVKHTYRSERPWGLPGGWIQSAETVAQGVAREVREETGLEVAVGRVLGILPGPYREIVIVFSCVVKGGCLAPGPVEVSELGYFPEQHLPSTEPLYRAAIALRRSPQGNPG